MSGAGPDGGDCPGIGGFGPVEGAHGLRSFDAGFFAHLAGQNATHLILSASLSANDTGNGRIYSIEKSSGDAACVMPYPYGATELAISDTHLYFAGHEPQGEGPPSNGWIRAAAIADGALSTLVDLPQMHPWGLIAHQGHLWFGGGTRFWRIPIAGGTPEDLGEAVGAAFGASAKGIFIAGNTEIALYDTSAGTTQPIVSLDPSISVHAFTLHSGWIYFQSYATQTESQKLFRAPDTGGAPTVVIDGVGNYYAVGAALFSSLDTSCPNSAVYRTDFAGGAGVEWIGGLCYVSLLADDDWVFALSNLDVGGSPGTLYRADGS